MRPLWLALVAAGVSTLAWAAEPVVPVDQIPVPGPRANAQPTPVLSAGDKIVILPFEVLGDTVDRRDWVARAVQQNLSAEAARLGDVFPISAPAPAGEINTAAARAAAQNMDGKFVVFGTCEFSGSGLRITGQIVNVKSGLAIGGLKAGGDLRDLFALEDQITSQMDRAFRPPSAQAETAQRAQDQKMIFTETTPPVTAADLYPAVPYTTQFANDYYNYYYDQGWPYGYGYGYPWFGGYGFWGIGSYWPVYSRYVPRISYTKPAPPVEQPPTMIFQPIPPPQGIQPMQNAPVAGGSKR
jgi:TolB-like protein